MSSIVSFMMLVSRRSRKIKYSPKKVFHSIQLGFTIRFALLLFVVAILYQKRWLIFWANIARNARAARDSMVGLISISFFKKI